MKKLLIAVLYVVVVSGMFWDYRTLSNGLLLPKDNLLFNLRRSWEAILL